MKVIQICPVVSGDGVGGGPYSVAVQQRTALAARGHDVTLLYGTRSSAGVPAGDRQQQLTTVVPPVLGYRAAFAPGTRRIAQGLAPRFDVAHVHLSRDLVTAPFARAWMETGRPFVIQTHGMVMPDRRLRSRVFDRVLLRQVLQAAPMVFALTETERTGLVELGVPPDRVYMLRNGIAPTGLTAAWPRGTKPEALFMSRLAPRKRPEVMVELARALSRAGEEVATRIVGPDQGSLSAVLSAVADEAGDLDVRYEAAVAPQHALTRMARAHVFVLPSIDEPYPMSLLEAMSIGLPCVITDSTGVSAELSGSDGVAVTDGSVPSMADAVRVFLSSEERWYRAHDANRRLVEERYGAAAVAATLDHHYASLLASRAPVR